MGSRKSSPGRSTWIWGIRMLVGFGLLGLLFWKIEITSLIEASIQANILFLVLAFGASVVGTTASAFIDKYLIAFFADMSLWAILRANFSTIYLSLAAPSSLGAMIGRPWVLSNLANEAMRPEEGVAVTIVGLLVSNLRRAMAGVIGLGVFSPLFPIPVRIIFGLSVSAYVAFTVVIWLSALSKNFSRGVIKLSRGVLRLFSDRSIAGRLERYITRGVEKTHGSLSLLAGDKKRILAFACLRGGVQCLVEGVRLWVLFMAFGFHFNFLRFLLLPSLGYSTSILPISIGGIGVAEFGGIKAFVAVLGIPDEIALTVTVLDRVFSMYWVAALGALTISLLKVPQLSHESRAS